MKSIMRIITLLLLSVALPATAIAGDGPKKDRSDKELIEVLKDEGYRAVDKLDDGVIRIRVGGLTYVLYVLPDKDLQLYFGLTGYTVTAAQLNEWNKTKRLGRVYIDDENDPVLESDLLANAGYTHKQFTEFVAVFDILARSFQVFLNQYQNAEQT